MLQKKIQEMQKQMMANAPAKLLIELGEEIQKIVALNIASGAKQLGDTAIDFKLQNDDRAIFSLTKALEKGPVILQFNRGAWCPYCDLQMKAWQERLSELAKLKTELVVIMPQLSDQVTKYKQENQFQFKILEDSGNKIAARYGLRFTVPKKVQELYKKFKIDIPNSNGDTSYTLPIPAIYIIGTDQKIKYAHVNSNWTIRPEPDEVIDVLKK